MFREVSSKISFAQLENDILRFWTEQRIFNKSIAHGNIGEQIFLHIWVVSINAYFVQDLDQNNLIIETQQKFGKKFEFLLMIIELNI